MNIKTVSASIAAGAAVGLACYAFSSTGSRKRHSIKKNADKTLKAAGELLQDITSVIG